MKSPLWSFCGDAMPQSDGTLPPQEQFCGVSNYIESVTPWHLFVVSGETRDISFEVWGGGRGCDNWPNESKLEGATGAQRTGACCLTVAVVVESLGDRHEVRHRRQILDYAVAVPEYLFFWGGGGGVRGWGLARGASIVSS